MTTTTTALQVHWRVSRGSDADGEMTVTTVDQVRQLVDNLASPDVDDAYVTHLGRPTTIMPLLGDEPVPDHVIHLAVRNDFGYIAYAGNTAHQPDGFTGYSEGDPHSPGTHGAYNTDYPAGTGLPLPLFIQAITELLETGEPSTCIRWINEDASSHRAAS